jgi:hypothetical protein
MRIFFVISIVIAIIVPLVWFPIKLVIIGLWMLCYEYKNALIAKFSGVIIASIICLFAIKYRIPQKTTHLTQAEVRFQMIDFGQLDFARSLVENAVGNYRVWLANPRDSLIQFVYVSKQDFDKIWHIKPFELKAQNKKVLVDLVLLRTYNNNVPLAEIEEISYVNDVPSITK